MSPDRRWLPSMPSSPPSLVRRTLADGVVDEAWVRRTRTPTGDTCHRRRTGWSAHDPGARVVRARQIGQLTDDLTDETTHPQTLTDVRRGDG